MIPIFCAEASGKVADEVVRGVAIVSCSPRRVSGPRLGADRTSCERRWRYEGDSTL